MSEEGRDSGVTLLLQTERGKHRDDILVSIPTHRRTPTQSIGVDLEDIDMYGLCTQTGPDEKGVTLAFG